MATLVWTAMGLDDVEMRLVEIEGRHFGSTDEAVASMLEAVAAINDELADHHVTADMIVAGDWNRRIRRWVERLKDIASRAARETGATSFSISVQAPPPSVGLSLTWDVEPAAQYGRFRAEARLR